VLVVGSPDACGGSSAGASLSGVSSSGVVVVVVVGGCSSPATSAGTSDGSLRGSAATSPSTSDGSGRTPAAVSEGAVVACPVVEGARAPGRAPALTASAAGEGTDGGEDADDGDSLPPPVLGIGVPLASRHRAT